MYNFAINNIVPAFEDELKLGTYIVLLNVRDVPPHLLLMTDATLFALSVKGPKLHLPLEQQLRLIRSKNVPSIFIKLTTKMLVHGSTVYKQAVSSILAYNRVEAGIATCLSPIKNFCNAVFNIEVNEANFIFELIPMLQKQGLIDTFYQLNLEPYLDNNTYYLPKYTMQDIYEIMTAASFQL